MKKAERERLKTWRKHTLAIAAALTEVIACLKQDDPHRLELDEKKRQHLTLSPGPDYDHAQTVFTNALTAYHFFCELTASIDVLLQGRKEPILLALSEHRDGDTRSTNYAHRIECGLVTLGLVFPDEVNQDFLSDSTRRAVHWAKDTLKLVSTKDYPNKPRLDLFGTSRSTLPPGADKALHLLKKNDLGAFIADTLIPALNEHNAGLGSAYHSRKSWNSKVQKISENIIQDVRKNLRKTAQPLLPGFG